MREIAKRMNYPRLNLIELDLKLTFHAPPYSRFKHKGEVKTNRQDVKLAKPEFAVTTVS